MFWNMIFCRSIGSIGMSAIGQWWKKKSLEFYVTIVWKFPFFLLIGKSGKLDKEQFIYEDRWMFSSASCVLYLELRIIIYRKFHIKLLSIYFRSNHFCFFPYDRLWAFVVKGFPLFFLFDRLQFISNHSISFVG